MTPANKQKSVKIIEVSTMEGGAFKLNLKFKIIIRTKNIMTSTECHND